MRINWLRTISSFEGPQMQVEVMELDESGYPQPTGRFETLEADTVILALGQDTDTGFLRDVPGVEFERDGTVKVSPSLMTGAPGMFAGGDMVPAERTVTVGVGHGKRAAREIDAWLRDSELRRAAPSTRWPSSTRSTSGTSAITASASSPSSSRRSAWRASRRSSAACPGSRPRTRRAAASRAATAASATAASAPARRTP